MLYQALAQFGGRGLMLLVYMILARMLGPADYGVFGYTLSVAQITCGIFFDLGLLWIVTRDLSLDRNAVFATGLLLKMLGCLLGCIVLAGLAPALNLPIILAVFLTAWAILNSFTDYHFCVFRAKNRMFGEALVMVSQRLLLLSLLMLIHAGTFAAASADPLRAAGGAMAVSGLLGLGLALVLVKSLFPNLFSLSGTTDMMQRMTILFRQALPLIGVSMFVSMYNKMGMVLLGMMATSEQVGYYAAPYRLFEASLLVPLLVLNSVYARLSREWADDPTAFRLTLRKMLGGIIGVGMATGCGIFILADPLVTFLFGAEFQPSATILRLLAVALVIGYPGLVLTHVLVIFGRQRAFFWLVLTAALANISLNVLLIPLWQANGTVLATILTELLILIIAAGVVLRHIQNRISPT